MGRILIVLVILALIAAGAYFVLMGDGAGSAPAPTPAPARQADSPDGPGETPAPAAPGEIPAETAGPGGAGGAVKLIPVKVEEVEVGGVKCVEISNAFVKMRFQPKGGKCVSFVYVPTGEELASKYGVFEDHVSSQSYLRSDFRRATFELTAVAQSEKVGTIKMTAKATTPEMAGVKLEKMIMLMKPSSAVWAMCKMTNDSKEKKELAFWHHNAFSSASGAAYFVPSASGVKRLAYDSKAPTREEWTRDPARSWSAMVAGKSGVACLAEYEKLDYFYNYLSGLYADIEWREAPEKVKVGESLKSEATVVAFGGLESVGGAGAKFVGEIAGPAKPKAGEKATYTLKVFAAEPDFEGTAKVYWRLGSERIRQPVKEVALKLEAGEVSSVPIEIALPVKGACVIGADLVVDGKAAGDILRTVDVGGTGDGGTVRIEPQAERLATAPKLPAGRMDILHSVDVPTRHVKWARPYYRGTMKIFVLSPVRPNGDTVALLKRFDTDYRVVTCDWSWEMNTWGMGDHYGRRSKKDAHGRDLEFGYMTEDVTSDMDFDVMVIPTVIGWNMYPERARKAIIERVRKGAGLVLITPQNEKTKPGDPIVLAHSPIRITNPTQYHWYGDWQRHVGGWRDHYGSKWTAGGRHFITDGLPLDAIPYANVAYSEATAAPGAKVLMSNDKGAPIVAVRDHGKGRIVAINWYTHQNSALTPTEAGKPPLPTYDYWEYFYSLLGRSCIWAARMEPEVDIAAVSTDREEYTPGQVAGGRLTVELENRTREISVDVEATFKDEFGKVQDVVKVSRDLAPGESAVDIPFPKGLAGGVNTCDVIVRNSGYSINWGSALFRVEQLVKVSKVTVKEEAVRNGGKITGSAAFACRAAGKGKAVFELRDPYDRVLAISEKETDFAADQTHAFDFTVKDWLALVGFVRAKAVIDGKVAYQADSNEFVVTPEEPGFTDYEVAPWGFTSRRNLWEVKARKFKEMGATATGGVNRTALRFGFGAKGKSGRLPLGIYYYSNRRQALADRWAAYKKSGMTTADKKKHLVRDHCFSRSSVREDQRKAISGAAKSQAKYNPGTYYIGDESSLTSYGMEAELCYTDECLARFRKWLEKEYGTLDALNRKWKKSYADWAEIVPPSIVEAQRDKDYVPWADHRTFMEIVYAENLEFLRAELKKIDPVGEMELTGTQAPTSFNAMDWARHMDHVKRFVPYSGNFMWDMCRCISPGVKMVGLTGYGSKGDGVKNSLWVQALHGLNGVNIFWEWSLVDADMTLSQNAEDIGEVFRELRGDGVGRLLTTCKWRPNDIAIHFSMPSVHAARLLNKESFPTQCRNGWCQMAQDLHYQFDIISYLQVERGLLNEKSYKVLVLPYTLAVSPEEVAEMRKFVEAGGTIIADTDCGKFDDHCDPGDVLGGLIDRAAGASKSVGKGKAVYLGKTIESYPKKRLSSEGEKLRAEIDALFVRAGARRKAEVTLAGKRLPRSEVVFLENGPLKITCVVKENLGGKRTTTADGVEYFIPFGEDFEKPVEKITVDLGAESHVYDVRARKYLGKVAKVEMEIVSAEAKMLSQLPYRVKSVSIDCQAAAKRGETLTVGLGVTADGGAPATHVLNVKVFGPEGERVYFYDRNIVAPGGKCQLSLPFALNAPAGEWKLIVRDVATGVEGTRTVVVGR